MKTLETNDQYALRLEYMGRRHGGYWLELICRDSGGVKILTSPRRESFNGITIEHALRWTSGQDWKPMYKKGVI